jgi:hypothetical protein
MGSHAEASVQNAVGETAATNPTEIAAPPSTEPLQTIAILDSRAPRSTTTPMASEQEKLVPSAVGNSTSARPSAEEAAIPGRQETLTRIIPSSEPTLVSGQSGSHHTYLPSQEDGTPGLEDVPLFSTEQDNTPGQDHPIDFPLESPSSEPSAESRVQPSMPRDVPPGRGDLVGVASPISPHAEPETRAAAQKNGTPDLERFFEKYKRMVRSSRFDEFRSILGRKRNSRSLLFTYRDCKDDDETKYHNFFDVLELPWKPRQVGQLRSGIILIEDADIECLLALDSKFGLDPRFIVRYVDYSHFLEPSHPPFGHTSCRNDAGMAGTWYTTSGTSAYWYDSSRTAQRGIAEATNGNNPWWGEAYRKHCLSVEGKFTVTSRIACYCLSDDLRKLRL